MTGVADATDVRRVVVRAPTWLGDVVMALPALRDLRRHFERAHFAVACPAPLTPVIAALPGVDAIVPLDGRVRFGGLRPSEADLARLRDGRFDLAILLTNSFRSAWTLSQAGVPERWGYRAEFRSALLTRAVRRPWRGLGETHHARYYLALLERLGLSTGPLEARLMVPPAARARGRAALERAGLPPTPCPLVGIAPGAANSHAKRWPPDRMAGLVQRLASLGIRSVLLGSAGDRPAARELESSLAASAAPSGGDPAMPPIDLVGATDLDLLMGVVAQCDAFVSNDSGAMHLAAAIGVPVAAIFGPTDERATAPIGPHRILASPVWCRPCHLRDCPIDHRCMKRVSVDMVLDAVTAMIRPPRAAGL
jgi:heptosyltransferase-2